MIVLLLNLLFSSLPVKCQTNNTQLKSQLKETVSHVHALLEDIEGKIESEKKLLSQIDRSLNNFNEPPGYLDYEVTDIWGGTTPPRSRRYKTIKSNTKKYAEGKPKRVIGRAQEEHTTIDPFTFKFSTLTHSPDTSPTRRLIISLTESEATYSTSATITTTNDERIPLPPNFSMPPGAPEGWVPFQVKTTTMKPLLKELKSKMAKYQIGYFSVFVSKYAEWIGYNNNREATQAIVVATLSEAQRALRDGKLNAMGFTFCTSIRDTVFFIVPKLSYGAIRQQAQVLALRMLQRRMFPKSVNQAIEFYESLMTPNEGAALFESLEHLEQYPESEKPAVAVVQEMVDMILQTLQRIQGSRNHRKLVSLVNTAVREVNPEMRARESDGPSGFATDPKLTNVSLSEDILLSNMSVLPSRRGMGHNIKKIMHHFLDRHPKLFKSFNKHYKRNKKKNRHRKSHKRNRHRYRKRHRKHKKHKRTRLHTRPSSRPTPRPSSHPGPRPGLRPGPRPGPRLEPRPGSRPGPRPGPRPGLRPSSRTPQNLRPARLINKNNKQANVIEDRTYRKNNDKFVDSSASEAFYREPTKKDNNVVNNNNFIKKPMFTIPLPAFSKNINAEYFKYLTKMLLLKRRNKSFRRFMSGSKEAVSVSQSENVQAPNNVNDVHVIRDASSYSDEEVSLRMNLYDALIHGNRTFTQFRRDNNDDQSNDIFGDTSSETDDEWIIKNNIYKVFEGFPENEHQEIRP